MAVNPAASLSVLPWVRQGAAAAIQDVDTLGPQRGAAEIPAALSVAGNPSPIPLQLRLRGPADVVGIDAQQIVRMEPRPGTRDFEPNYFPCVELDRADFPWLFTPAMAGVSSRLRPWLCLIVVRKQEGIVLGTRVDAPLAALEIQAPAKPADELPHLEESWAWAHAQAAAADSSAGKVHAALAGAPQLSLSRLLCPRLLAADTDYIACLVPTFELGRRAGLGMAISDAEVLSASALQPAWSLSPAPTQVLLPVYHHWEFHTGRGGDFESLAARLRPRPAPEGFARRPIDISRPGFTPAPPEGTRIDLAGALQPIGSAAQPDPWDPAIATPFRVGLAGIVNRPANALVEPGAQTLLAPPLYGRPYAPRATASVAGATWFDQLNLDPRWRSVAAFGTRVVQEHQEALMASAWEQAAQLQLANQQVRQLQLGLAVGESLHARHFARMSPEQTVRVGAPAFGRLRAPTATSEALQPLTAQVMGSLLPLPATSAAMRRIGRARGPIARRTQFQGVARSTTMTWVACLNASSTGILAAPRQELVTISALTAIYPPLLRFWELGDAHVASTGGQPFFKVVSKRSNEPVVPYTPGFPAGTDSTSARHFRRAAIAHLSRIQPGRAPLAASDAQALPMQQVQQVFLQQTQPRLALLSRARAMVTTGDNVLPSSAATGPEAFTVVPKFPQPMYEPLRDLSQDLLLPHVEDVLPDSVLGLETNRRFIEAYLVGLNFEMGREMLWRGFPTDQRGTYFDRFWDAGAAAAQPDIPVLHQWGNRSLGDGPSAPAQERFVMLVRSALLQRYPNATIYLVRAVLRGSVRVPGDSAADEVLPMFSGSLQPDLSFFGFDRSTAAVTGSDGSHGYYLVIQEHPTEPRFGLDVGISAAGTHIRIGAGVPAGVTLPGGLEWGRNSAHMAGITRQLPVRIAIHASRLLGPLPTN